MTDLLEQLKRHEGFREKPYKCTGDKLTIGYGWNLDDVGISEALAEFVLQQQVSYIQLDCLREFEWYRDKELKPARRDVVTNMCFNLGLAGFKKFKKAIKAIEEKNYEEASKEMLDSRWARQVGNRAEELAEQMKTGEYTE